MRGLVIDYVRSRRARKRGREFEIVSLETEVADRTADDGELTRIGDALDELASVRWSTSSDPELVFFCGFTFAEIAALRGTSERTVQRQWEKARIYLYRALAGRA